MSPLGQGECVPIPQSVPAEPPLTGEYDRTDFECQAVVGRGGNAVVSRATTRSAPSRVVALKEPHADHLADDEVERFRAEAKRWTALDDHAHIVDVHAWGTDPQPWIALAYVDGGSLGEIVGDCDPAQGLWTGACVAAALDHAHRAGVAHRDLKPANVLLETTGPDRWPVAQVSDWGLAGPLGDDGVNLEGLSPRYAAPEQFAPDRFGPPGVATDVYQLGVVLYELLVGRPPFDGPARSLHDAVLHDVPPPASGRRAALHPAVDDLLDRALAKDPGARYESAYGFRRAIERTLADEIDVEADAALAGPRDVTFPDRPPQGGVQAGTSGGTGPPSAPPYDRALTLAEEGFVQLSEGYFSRRAPAPPLEAWRRGVTLADAHAGRAIERTIPTEAGGDRVSLTERLLDGLLAGTDHVVLGPPGSGKSTVCKQVACTWFDRGHGPVFYRESGRGEPFDRPDELARRLSGVDGHALVVVEDAVRPAATAAFSLRERVAERPDVTLLLDARESEWRGPERDVDPFADNPVAQGRAALEPTYVPRPDAHEQSRFVRAIEAAADGDLEVDYEQLRSDVRQAATATGEAEGARPGELFYLLHRLTTLARDPLADVGGTTLTDAVAEVYDDLAARDRPVLDVGVCVNLCNAAGIGVRPAVCHAVASEDPLAVTDAVDVLAGRVLFPREGDWSDGTRTYPTVHEAWSTAFLAHLLDAEGAAAASERFGRVASRVLALADDEAERERIAGALDGEAPVLARIGADPTDWADETVAAVYALARSRPKLAPLYGDGETDTITLPESCSPAVADRRPTWLGRAFLAGGYFDRAERVFERLPATPTEQGFERLLGLAAVATERGAFEAAADHAERCLTLVADADRPIVCARARLQLGQTLLDEGDYVAAESHFRDALDTFEAVADRRRTAKTLYRLGVANFRQDAFDRAESHLERSLAIRRDIGERQGEADCLNSLGLCSRMQGEYDHAREYHERSLEIKRELGDRKGVANCLGNLGVVASLRGDHEEAREYHERALERDRALGNRQGEQYSLANLGNGAYRQGAYERAREYHDRALAIAREIGDRKGEKDGLESSAIATIKLGAYDEAKGTIEQALALAREMGDRSGEAISLGHLGAIARHRGNDERARDHLERSLELYREIGFPVGEAYCLGNLALLARRRGDVELAREQLEDALGIAQEMGHVVETVKAYTRLGDLARDQGAFDRAAESFAVAADVEDDASPFERARLQLATGRLAIGRGDTDAARERAEGARAAFAEMGARHWVARCRRHLGRIDARTDDLTAARQHWEAALAGFEAVGAPDDELATLHHLVELPATDGDGTEWRARAHEALADAPAPVAERHRAWVDHEPQSVG